MVDYTISIKRPFSDITKLVIGIVVSIIPIVNLIAIGYQLNCAKTAMKRKFDLPEWTDIGGLLVKGLLALVIGLIYAIIPLGVIVFAGGTFAYAIWSAVMTGATPAIGSLLIGAGIGLLVGLLLLLFVAYIAPIAVLKYITTDKFGEAFDIGGVLGKAFSVSYFVSWLVAVVYSLIVSIIAGILVGWIPLLGPFLSMAISSFIGGVTAWTIFGQVYSEK